MIIWSQQTQSQDPYALVISVFLYIAMICTLLYHDRRIRVYKNITRGRQTAFSSSIRPGHFHDPAYTPFVKLETDLSIVIVGFYVVLTIAINNFNFRSVYDIISFSSLGLVVIYSLYTAVTHI